MKPVKHPVHRRRRRRASASGRCSALLPALRERHRAGLRRRQRRERRRRRRDHAEDRRPDVRRRRRRDHARQPHLPPARDLRRTSTSEERILRPANFLRSQPGHGSCVVDAAAACGSGVVSLSGNLFMNAGRPAFAEADAALHALRGQGRPRARRHARRGDQREGRDGLAPRRPRDRRRRHPHARPDRRRAGPARAAPPTSPTSA